MEAVRISETSVNFNESTQRHVAEGHLQPDVCLLKAKLWIGRALKVQTEGSTLFRESVRRTTAVKHKLYF
jgi:hypothetical protein